MGLFDHFPYTNFHELNITWLLEKVKELENTIENFVALNTIKYADPIQWNITTQYEANTVVVDPQSGTAYISTKAVPTGVAISNTDYWSVIFTLDIISANKNLTLRDDGSNVLATFASNAGDWLLWNGTLYKVSQAININEAYVAGYNLTRYTVELFIDDCIQSINTLIGDLNDLDTTDQSSIVNAINELVALRGDLADLLTTDKTSIVNAINEVNSKVNDVSCIIPFDNVAALTAADLTVGDVVKCLGYYNANDGGDGLFKISDTAAGFHHTLNNGLYANNIDDDFKLPRYGGYFVNQMMDNARPFMTQHQWKHIILPVASANHPGCKSYIENGKTIYFWVVNAPIVYDETLAYSINDYYDRVILDLDATNKEAIIKVSDSNKPEDIYFNGNLFIEGWHMDGNYNFVENALLVEGSARLNIQNLQAGWADNSITLGGDNALNPIHVHVDFLEFGSCREHGIYAKNSQSTIFTCNSAVFENAQPTCTHMIYAEGAIFNWHIGDLQNAQPNLATSETNIELNLTGLSTREIALQIDTMRCGDSSGKNIVLKGSAGSVYVGYGLLQSTTGTVEIDNESTAGLITIGTLETRGMPTVINNSGTSSMVEIVNTTISSRTVTGNNVKVNNVIQSGYTTTFTDGLIIRDDQTPTLVQLKNNGTTITI